MRAILPSSRALARARGLLIWAASALICQQAFAQADGTAAEQMKASEGQVVGIAFVGRIVADLDQSVAFYKLLGFSQDPAAKTAWRKDPVLERLVGATGFETRMAKMFVVNQESGQRFVVYLRELRGIERQNLASHAAWKAGSSHFGLVVPDAARLWSELRRAGQLRARSWGDELVGPPGESRGMLAYITDPDGLDIELIDQRPAVPSTDGRPPRPAFVPGVSHVGLVVLDAERARAFYGKLLGGRLQSPESPWVKGDFYDSAVGGHGNVLRFFNESFAFAPAPDHRMNFELVEFQNRRDPVAPFRVTDIGVGYVGIEVQGLDAFVARAKAAGARPVSDAGIVTMASGTREILLRDPDVGGFVELYEHPGH